LVASVVEFARAELLQAGIVLDTHLAPGFEVEADESQLRQALLNLIRNAREAMERGGRLTVNVASRPDGMAAIEIGDTGSGIAQEHLSKLFDPFFSTKAKGTGLGLALVQQIAVEHGGRVEVDSGGATMGTTFRFLLPLLREVAQGATSAGPGDSPIPVTSASPSPANGGAATTAKVGPLPAATAADLRV
jgi:signal transduction histidine kinase